MVSVKQEVIAIIGVILVQLAAAHGTTVLAPPVSQ